MSGDTPETLAETDASVPSKPLALESLVNGDRACNSEDFDSDFHEDDMGSRVCHSSEMKVLDRNHDGVEAKLGKNGKVSVEVHGSLDAVFASGEICVRGDGNGYAAENGKDTDEAFKEILGSVSEMCQNGDVGGTREKRDEIDSHRKEKCEEGDEDAGQSGDEDGDDDNGNQEHEFYEGKFVWAKIRNNPWWPGQIYNPSDASEFAKKFQKRKKLLVAFFGDGSFSWCSPSQLKPFAENFEKLSKQSTSGKFIFAVQEALDEISRLVEYQTTCSCVSEENPTGLTRPVAVNAGVKQGVLVPDYGFSELSIPHHEPAKIISLLRDIAVEGSFTRILELTVLRSWLSAFYRANGGKKLAMFNGPQLVEGLEDKSRSGLVDASGPLLDPDEGPPDEVWSYMPVEHRFSKLSQPLLQKCDGLSASKLYRRRKRKSVAKLLKEGNVTEPSYEKGNMVKDISSSGKGKARARPQEGLTLSDGDLPSSLGRMKGRRKVETFKSLEEVFSAENNVSESEKRIRKKEVSMVEKDGDELVSAYGKKRRKKALVSLDHSENKVMSLKNGDGDFQAVSNKENEVEFSAENDEEITKGETENISWRKEGKRETRSSSKDSKRKRGDDEACNLGGGDQSSPVQMNTRKRKNTETLESSELAEEKKKTAKDGSKNRVSVVGNDKLGEIEDLPASRQRKRSAYLSPPFTSFKSITRNLSTKAARVGERMTRVAGQVIGSGPMLKSVNEPLHNNLFKEVEASIGTSPNPSSPSKEEQTRRLSPKPALLGGRMTRAASQVTGSTCTRSICEVDTAIDRSPNSSPPPPEQQKKMVGSVQIDLSMKELVSEVRSAATNPLFLREKKVIDMIEGFNLAYRDATYSDGSYYKMHHNAQQGDRQNSLETESKTMEEERSTSEEASKPSSLMLIFPPGFCLPSKNDLISVFSDFGPVNEMETDVSNDSYRAKVVFCCSDDTEKAFDTCLQKNPFASAEVSYRLRYSAGPSKTNEISKNPETLRGPANAEGSQLLFIKQKLEIMTSMVDSCRGNLSKELALKLEEEVKGLMDQISSITKSNSTQKTCS